MPLFLCLKCLIALITIHSTPYLCEIQKSVSFNPQTTFTSNDAYITLDSQISIANNEWRIAMQSKPQTAYDFKVSLHDEWGFKSNTVSSVSVNINGIPLNDIGNDMNLYLVFAVNNSQYLSVAAHLDKNGNKYATYPELVNIEEGVSDWINNVYLNEMRHSRISNDDEWIENAPEYTSRAQFPITFEFINDPIHNQIIYQFYSNTAAVTGRQYITSFVPNTNIEIYIMTDEPKEDLFISDITVSLSYDTNNATPSPTIRPTLLAKATKTSLNTYIDKTHNKTVINSTITPFISTANILNMKVRYTFDVINYEYLLTITCSVLSFLIGIVISIAVCNIKQSKTINEEVKHDHEAVAVKEEDVENDDNSDILMEIAFELSKTKSDDYRDENMHLINNNSDAYSGFIQSNIAIDDEDEDEDEFEDMYTNTVNTVNTVTVAHCSTPRTFDLECNSLPFGIGPSLNRRSSSLNINIMSQQRDEYIMAQWLENVVELPQYFDNFQREGYQSLKFIKEISNKAELSDIGIVIKGHQTKIMAEIQKLNQNTQVEGSKICI